MILSDKGFTRVSALRIIGRETVSKKGKIVEDWLLVDYNGNKCKIGLGFFGKVDIGFRYPERAIIRHMVCDDRSENEYLRFPIFEGFYYN